MTEAGTSARRASQADFLKALHVALEENGAHLGGLLPRKFKLTDETLASFMRCALWN